LVVILSLLAVVAAAWLTPRDAHAAKGAIIITWGDGIKHIADVPPQYQADVERFTQRNDLRIGYKHRHFGIFWLDLWGWDGVHCLYAGKTFYRLTPHQAAMLLGTTPDALPRPFFYRFPPGIPALIGFIALCFVYDKHIRRKVAEAKKLLEDSRYFVALSV